ncbi:MAG: hypothetical protein K2L22_08015 [Muribaculaceae bacterium]|nr:hypothetical protein [Muribaculaceae bacterium]
MKRYVLLILVAILTSGIATAQNANRSGFFLEAGIGGLIGNTPRNSFSITDNVMYYKCLSGAAADFGLGARARMNNHWAYEFKAEATIPLNNPINALVGRCLPVGFRYTSPEIWRNYSLYTHFNVGGAIVVNGGIAHSNEVLLPNLNYVKFGYVDGGERYGAAYSLGLGINITTHFYVEAVFDGQAIFNSYGKNGLGTNVYGMVGCVVGYRF